METGEAGPPGTKLASRLPQGENGSTTLVKGYAGAPGYPPVVPVSFAHEVPSGDPQTTVRIPLLALGGARRASDTASFSAGLTMRPFSDAVGTICFNKVLLNDGGHYDPHTGLFTAPIDGRYLLSAVVTAQRVERVEVVLMVSNRSVHKLDTAVPGGGATDSCVCGGSASFSLVLELKRSNRVGLQLRSGMLAASSEILSSFSGVLLYATPTQT